MSSSFLLTSATVLRMEKVENSEQFPSNKSLVALLVQNKDEMVVHMRGP